MGSASHHQVILSANGLSIFPVPHRPLEHGGKGLVWNTRCGMIRLSFLLPDATLKLLKNE
jgi:hypothetical protein